MHKTIKVNKVKLNPSEGEHSIIPNQFIWRTEKRFVGDSEIAIADNQEAIWWNRPLVSDTLYKKEADGLYSYNLPFWQGNRMTFKTEYNVLLNKNSVPCAIHIQIDDSWTDEQKELLKTMLNTCLYNTLIDMGVNSTDIRYSGNDFYYQEKKFACGEEIFENNIFSQNVIITIQALPEKEIFARLTGKYAHRKQIVGIADEVPTITKEAFIDKLYKKVQAYVEEHFN